jgi:drug/metabolite transporter (DMT)-like permease
MNQKTKGILALVIAALGFALMSVFVKLVDNSIPVTQKVLFRNGISVLISFTMVVLHKSSFYGKKNSQPLLLLRSTFGTIGMLLFFYSISALPISDANMLNKLSTFFLIIFSALFLKEKVRPYQILMIVLAFIGSLFIIKPSLSIDLFPYITSIVAAMFAGAAYTVLRALGKKEEYYTVVLYFSSFSVISITLLMLVINAPLFNFVAMTKMEWIYLTLAGVFATLGQFGTTLAYKYAPANEISIFNYTNVVFASIFGLMFFDTIPDGYSLIGYIIIFSAALYMFLKKDDRF